MSKVSKSSASKVSRRGLLKSTAAKVLTGATAASLLSAETSAQTTTPRGAKGKKSKGGQIRHLNPDTLATPRGYSHVVEATGGRMIFIAGQVAQDKAGNIVGKDNFRAQAVQVFENLKNALTAVGADFSHVVKFNTYVTQMSQIQTLREVRNQYYTAPNPPASTLVEVSKLARDEYLLEIEAIAVLPE